MISMVSPEIGQAERDRVQHVLSSGQLADGEEVRAFEDEFAQFCGTTNAVATTNGTTALHATFEALGIGAGDAVITSPFSFVASANSIRHAGATPVFADIEPETLTLDPDAVEDILEDRDDVAAILPVHLYGTPARMERFVALKETYDIALVEDAAQAHGARYHGEPVGSLGDVACFSFYPTKNMTAGEGGMITTDDEDLAIRAARFCDHGRTEGYDHATVGHNFRMTSICAGIGRAQLSKLPRFNRARRGHAAYLSDKLGDCPVDTPIDPPGIQSVYHQYTIRTDNRDELRRHLTSCGIESAVYYPTPIHQQPAFADINGQFPVAERAADRVLSLPVHPDLSTPDLMSIASAVSTFDIPSAQLETTDRGWIHD